MKVLLYIRKAKRTIPYLYSDGDPLPNVGDRVAIGPRVVKIVGRVFKPEVQTVELEIESTDTWED